MHAACYTIKSSNGGLETNELLIEAIKYFIKIAVFEKLTQNEGNQIPIFHSVSFLEKNSSHFIKILDSMVCYVPPFTWVSVWSNVFRPRRISTGSSLNWLDFSSLSGLGIQNMNWLKVL